MCHWLAVFWIACHTVSCMFTDQVHVIVFCVWRREWPSNVRMSFPALYYWAPRALTLCSVMHTHLGVVKCFRDSKRTAKYLMHHTGKKMSVQICTCIVLFTTPDMCSLILQYDGLLNASSHATFISNTRGLSRVKITRGNYFFLCNLFLFWFLLMTTHICTSLK